MKLIRTSSFTNKLIIYSKLFLKFKIFNIDIQKLMTYFKLYNILPDRLCHCYNIGHYKYKK